MILKTVAAMFLCLSPGQHFQTCPRVQMHILGKMPEMHFYIRQCVCEPEWCFVIQMRVKEIEKFTHSMHIPREHKPHKHCAYTHTHTPHQNSLYQTSCSLLANRFSEQSCSDLKYMECSVATHNQACAFVNPHLALSCFSSGLRYHRGNITGHATQWLFCFKIVNDTTSIQTVMFSLTDCSNHWVKMSPSKRRFCVFQVWMEWDG